MELPYHDASSRPAQRLPDTFDPTLGPAGVPSRAPDVVIGLGNEIARDDGVGIAAARELECLLAGRQGLGPSSVEVLPLPWAGFALLDALVGRRRAALIDCLVSGAHPPGTVVRLDESDVSGSMRLDDWHRPDASARLAGSVRLNSFHDIAFPVVLALGRDLGWPMPEEIAIWAIEAAVVDRFGEGLSEPVAAALPRVAGEVLRFLNIPTLPGAGR